MAISTANGRTRPAGPDKPGRSRAEEAAPESTALLRQLSSFQSDPGRRSLVPVRQETLKAILETIEALETEAQSLRDRIARETADASR
jgi:hypothetical protein